MIAKLIELVPVEPATGNQLPLEATLTELDCNVHPVCVEGQLNVRLFPETTEVMLVGVVEVTARTEIVPFTASLFVHVTVEPPPETVKALPLTSGPVNSVNVSPT